MTPDAVSCTVLAWDSEFFGVRIGRVHADRLSAADAEAAVRWGGEEGLDCLYSLVDAEHTPTLRALAAHGFQFVDIRLTLDRALNAEPPPASAIAVRLAGPPDRGVLESLARVSHRNTRFYEDGRFDRTRCDELYATWIAKALDDPEAFVLVPDIDGRLGGYLSIHQPANAEARVGLIALAPDLQGRGVGEALMAEAFARLAARGPRRIAVVTQGRNARAVRFYEKCGFRTRTCQFWYHRWFPR